MPDWIAELLSSLREWHALVLGALVMYLGSEVGPVAELVAFLVLVLGAIVGVFGDDSVLENEPWYGLAGGALGFLVSRFEVIDLLVPLF